jgi:hypothetical protein
MIFWVEGTLRFAHEVSDNCLRSLKLMKREKSGSHGGCLKSSPIERFQWHSPPSLPCGFANKATSLGTHASQPDSRMRNAIILLIYEPQIPYKSCMNYKIII